MLAAGLVGIVWAIFGHTGGGHSVTAQTPSTSPMTSLTAPPESAAPPQPRLKRLPGTDNQGWINYPSARCNPENQPVVMARTAQSVLVVCQIQPGNFYYRGVRLSDGASIELANAVRSSAGFDVTNPTDGSRYQIRPTTLTIAPPDGPASTEPMLDCASG
jgi:serine/threonine-protein kinase